MKEELGTIPIPFLEDWTSPPVCSKDTEEALQGDKVGLTEVKKWRFQTLLAVNPWGIPLLAFGEAYKQMYGKELDLTDLGYENLTAMVYSLKEVFTVQEPDEVTALLFSSFSGDRILHDARLGHKFEKDPAQLTCLSADSDPESLIARAWLNRDDDFPQDVAFPGDKYTNSLLPVALANVPGTLGVHQAVILSAASPSQFYISIKSELLDRISKLSIEVTEFFKKVPWIGTYWVPPEFIFSGFPCLVYIDKEDSWERCEIIDRSTRTGKVLVESVDYGGIRTVNPCCLYLMPRQFIEIPKQALRVSMLGICPSNGTKRWSSETGKRLRCFSNQQYWLDCLLIEPKSSTSSEDDSNSASLSDSKSTSSSDLSCDGKDSIKMSVMRIKKKNKHAKPDFEVIVCDRNDCDMNIYVEEILTIENYATSDSASQEELKTLKEKFEVALKDIPRPKNALNTKMVKPKINTGL